MALIRIGGAALLAGLVVLAHFALGKQAEWTGLFTLDEVFAYTNRVLPNTKIPIRLPSTGLAQVDNYFAFMTAFFYGSLDPRNVRAHLQGNYLVGTLGSIWVHMLVEAHRGRRSTSFLAITYVFEFLGELVGIGMMTPIWCIFHLFMTSQSSTKGDLAAPARGLGALGYAIIIGHVVPTVLMMNGDPEEEGLASQQWWSVLRLFHPLFVFVTWKGLDFLQTAIFGSTAGTTAQPEQRLSSVRKFYIFSILISGFFHASTLALLLAPYLAPGWLRLNILASLDIGTFFAPTRFWDPTVVEYSRSKPIPFEMGVTAFLYWDNLCAASAILVWAGSLYLESATKLKAKVGSSLSVILQSALVTVLAGPGAAAAYLSLERDSAAAQLVSAKEDEKKKKR